MKPLNQAERRKAFLKFLLFFLITVTVVVIAVLSSVQVPLKDNEKLRRERTIAENERMFLQSFEMKMLETTRLLDSFETVKNEYMLEEDIKRNISGMTAMMNDTIAVNTICSRIVDNLTSLHVAKKQLREVSNKSAEIENKNREIEKLQTKVDELNGRIIQLLAGNVR